MYGINLLEIARILGSAAVSTVIFSKYGAIRSIYQEIVKYSALQNIEMVKAIVRTLAQQNEQAYSDILETLRQHFTEQELQEILPR